jgi:hypothetical protein
MFQYLIKGFCLLNASYLSGWYELDVCRQTTERPEPLRAEEPVSSKNGSWWFYEPHSQSTSRFSHPLSNFFGSPMESDIYPEENLTQLIDFMRWISSLSCQIGIELREFSNLFIDFWINHVCSLLKNLRNWVLKLINANNEPLQPTVEKL